MEEKKTEWFLDEVVAIMKEKGIKFEKTKTDHGACLRTKTTEMGNYLQLRTVGNCVCARDLQREIERRVFS